MCQSPPVPFYSMSTFFKDLDEKSRNKIAWSFSTNKEYEKITKKWREPFEKKKLLKERRALREAEQEPVTAQDAVIYVHSPEHGVSIPAHPDNIFAVIRVNGQQIKVLNNEVVRVEKLPFEVGE